MTATASFRTQHTELVDLVGKIVPLLNPSKLAESAVEVRGLFLTLLGKLSIHLAMEDNALYPQLMKHSDAKVRDMAKAFADEMSNLKPAVTAFSIKWSEDAIRKNAGGFCDETKKLFEVLGNRIVRENTQLYELADHVG